LTQQTLPAAEIVMVWDGLVDSSVETCVKRYEPVLPFRHLRMRQNRGLGSALRDGLNACRNELIARVDSDDWSAPTRFEQQIEFLRAEPNVSVLGGWLKEWYHQKGTLVSAVRRSPLQHHSIKNTAKIRNPINHPTVMFRKSHILACGSYESCPLFEDYFLWAKLLTRGYVLRNLPEIFVETDVDSEYFRRRGGLAYIKNELNLIRKLEQIGFLNHFEACIFFLSRSPIRFTPVALRETLYRALLRK
jgi:glycosyltransferase involved in cell wall biosynthesis